VLGAAIAYFICLFGGFLPMRTSRAMELHRLLFETLPGFSWIELGSVLLGAVHAFVFAWIFAWYFVWMYNSSLETRATATTADRAFPKSA
jgi:hypothetical protein